MEGGLRAKNQLDSTSRFDTIPACDGRTDVHSTTACTALALRRAVEGDCCCYVRSIRYNSELLMFNSSTSHRGAENARPENASKVWKMMNWLEITDKLVTEF